LIWLIISRSSLLHFLCCFSRRTNLPPSFLRLVFLFRSLPPVSFRSSLKIKFSCSKAVRCIPSPSPFLDCSGIFFFPTPSPKVSCPPADGRSPFGLRRAFLFTCFALFFSLGFQFYDPPPASHSPLVLLPVFLILFFCFPLSFFSPFLRFSFSRLCTRVFGVIFRIVSPLIVFSLLIWLCLIPPSPYLSRPLPMFYL